MLLVALGTSETAGAGLGPYGLSSPELAHPARYADIICTKLGRPVELRSYFPTVQLAPIAWWIDRVDHDARLRSDLGKAEIVMLWAMSVHDSIEAFFLPGSCAGAWPDPLQGCLESRLSDVPTRTDELFGLIEGLVGSDAVVLASDAYAPPVVLSMLTGNPDRDDIQALIDPYAAVHAMAPKHGFVFVDTELVFNGETREAMPASGLFQPDGLHPTEAGAALIAETYRAADGIVD